MNRLTDERLKEMCDPNLYAIRERNMAQELLTLRKEPSKKLISSILKELFEAKEENERLRKRVDEFVYIGWSSSRGKTFFQYNGPDPVEKSHKSGVE